ncbi:MAG: TonB-dependent receptor plug domain-containing protein [Bacteroidia bacterium]|nr:TonB-dependent receptor plug domain-containing protein [Bacteroidia bacterium]
MRKLLTVIMALALSIPVLAQMTIKDGMVQIADRHGVNFVYDPALPVGSPYKGKSLAKGKLEENLDALFKDSGIRWERRKQFIVLTAAKPDAPVKIEQPAIFDEPNVRMDTLQAAVMTDFRRIEMGLGRLQTSLNAIRVLSSPLGEGDAVRWAQSLPGVTTGADGTTSMYVRGGNAGNNLFSLDGVPVYGYSHILGLTTIVPSDIVESASLAKGGFDGGDSNFTAAHLRMVTKEPSDVQRTSVALNNFLASASTEGPLGQKLSYLLSIRYSPLTWEYRAVQSSLPELVSGLSNFSANVGDVYAKIRMQTGAHSSLDASFLGSLDSYGFNTPDASYELMAWNNIIGLLRFRHYSENIRMELTASANGFGSRQEQEKWYRYTKNNLSLQSRLNEYALAGNIRHTLPRGFSLNEGFNLRWAQFAPGQVSGEDPHTNTLLSTVWVQGEYTSKNKFAAKAVVRCHYFNNLASDNGGRFDIEGNISAKVNFTEWLSLELTADRMVQYYHSLEGMPVGWSLDMIVPTGPKVVPETALQGNVGLTAKFDNVSVSFGGFYKAMDGLIFYKYAPSLFSGALATWEDNVDFGKGTAYGAEFLFEYQGKDFYSRLAYTLSKTDRHNFKETNNGLPFHARFDRSHVLNAMAQWKGICVTLILQSGNWENGAAETFQLHLPGKEWTAKYYSGVNNYHMPTVIRLDLGYQFGFMTGSVEHKVNIGVCNVTNHFNPFMLYFDTGSESWKELALLPFLPNFSYRIEF